MVSELFSEWQACAKKGKNSKNSGRDFTFKIIKLIYTKHFEPHNNFINKIDWQSDDWKTQYLKSDKCIYLIYLHE